MIRVAMAISISSIVVPDIAMASRDVRHGSRLSIGPIVTSRRDGGHCPSSGPKPTMNLDDTEGRDR
jgi:hypothetical protein